MRERAVTYEHAYAYPLRLNIWCNGEGRLRLIHEEYGGWFVPCRIIVFSGRKGEKAPRKNPPNGDFFVFSHGDLSPRHTKVRHFSCVAFSPPVCRIFAWRGERSPRENPPKSPFGVFTRGDQRYHKQGRKRERSPRETPPNDDFFVLRLATFRPATRKYATFHALRFRLLFVVSLPGEAKGRPENTFIRHGINQPPYEDRSIDFWLGFRRESVSSCALKSPEKLQCLLYNNVKMQIEYHTEFHYKV